jgi:hypothetical protein
VQARRGFGEAGDGRLFVARPRSRSSGRRGGGLRHERALGLRRLGTARLDGRTLLDASRLVRRLSSRGRALHGGRRWSRVLDRSRLVLRWGGRLAALGALGLPLGGLGRAEELG